MWRFDAVPTDEDDGASNADDGPIKDLVLGARGGAEQPAHRKRRRSDEGGDDADGHDRMFGH